MVSVCLGLAFKRSGNSLTMEELFTASRPVSFKSILKYERKREAYREHKDCLLPNKFSFSNRRFELSTKELRC
jgi:hypothetical protein